MEPAKKAQICRFELPYTVPNVTKRLNLLFKNQFSPGTKRASEGVELLIWLDFKVPT